MKKLLVAAALLVLLLVSVVSVSAVTNGQPDGNGHPYVGVAIQPIPSMPGFVTVCSRFDSQPSLPMPLILRK